MDPFGVSPVVSGFGSGLAGGVTVAGSLQVAGLEVLGARAYDPVSRGFMSPDPVPSPVGAGWGANVYSFVGNAPSVLVDPWGLSPMTAAQFKEYREDVSGRAVERLGKGLADFARDNAGWIALGVAAVGVAALAVSGPVGWGILTGMLISGGVELGSQWLSVEPIDWKKVALSASIGGVAGGFGAGVASLVTKLGSSVFGFGVRAMAGRAAQIGARADEAASWGSRLGNSLASRYGQAQAAWSNAARGLSGVPQKVAGFGQKLGYGGAKEMVGAYVEAGVDTSLTYVMDGHHVTAGGLVQAWGVPAVSNALVPRPVSKGADAVLRKTGWDAAEGVAAKWRSLTSDGLGNFVNGVASYSGAPMTYSAQFESYQGKDYKGPGWHRDDAIAAGLKEMAKGGVSSSRPVGSLKSVSFDVGSGGGFDDGGAVRDLGLLGSGASGVQASVGVMVENVREGSGE
ncbi:RHS repeat-associated core domain-containing protein [Rothia sp. P5766]|uniref:RHS repeat-associated core domain-containing protein n=1 Tax=Rothia sp. P5766 TaxID=3402656 RepID=UPI003AE5CA73